jgi:hypothetical protein
MELLLDLRVSTPPHLRFTNQAILLCVKPSHIQIDNLPSLQMTLANNHQAKTFGMLREKEHTTPIIKQQALTMKSNSWHIHYNFKA